MALTDLQRAEVRRYLGYSDSSAGLYSTLESAMTALSASGETIVVRLLTDLASLETALSGSWSIQKVKRAEEVELWGLSGLVALRQEGNRLVTQLATMFGVAVVASPFSAGSRCGISGRG